jgi:hypothetical protein
MSTCRNKTFLLWAQENGARLHPCCEWPVIDVLGNRGVAVTVGQTVKTGDELFSVPSDIILKPSRLSIVGGDMDCERHCTWIGMDTALALTIVLLHECLEHQRSFWWPWLDILPKAYPCGTHHWEQSHLDSLQDDGAEAQIQLHAQRMEMARNSVETILRSRKHVLQTRMQWIASPGCSPHPCNCSGCAKWKEQSQVSRGQKLELVQIFISNIEAILGHLQQKRCNASGSWNPSECSSETWFDWAWQCVCSRGWNHPSQVSSAGCGSGVSQFSQ